MNELSLFSGAGGGLLATTHFLEWRTIGYVEWDEYCQQVLRARIDDGYLRDAPIFGDIRAFIGDGYAASYTGLVDVISAGFPCQPFSTAGRRRGEDDDRNMWPETAECIRIIRPCFALLENVPGLLSSGYFGTVLGDLAACGYDARWRVLSAAEVGAPHRRDRLFIVAYPTGSRPKWQSEGNENTRLGLASGGEGQFGGTARASVADTERQRCHREQWGRAAQQFENGCASVVDAESVAARGLSIREDEKVTEPGGNGGNVPDASREGLSQWQWTHGEWTHATVARSSWWTVEPRLGRVAHGVARRVDRLKAIGNGQVPAVVACIWRLLNEAD